MPHFFLHKQRLWIALILATVLLACSLPDFLSHSTQPASSAAQSSATQAGAPNTNPNALLADPAAGLAELTSYHIVLDQSVQGTLDGKPYQRSVHVEYSLAMSHDEELLREITSTGNPDLYLYSATIGGASYSLRAKDAPCQGGPIDPQQEPIIAPAKNLLPVILGDRVGDEAVNGIPAVHYRFTQAGLQIAEKDIPVSGDVWIASPGGFVVEYLLATPAPAHPSGTGLEAGRTWNYELTQANAIDQLVRPSACAPVPLGIPVLADAQDVEHSAGQLTYSTVSDTAAVTDFYKQQLPSSGWKNIGTSKPKDSSEPTLLYYEKGNLELTILLDSSSGTLQVTAVLSEQAASETGTPTAAPGAGARTQPAPTATG